MGSWRLHRDNAYLAMQLNNEEYPSEINKIFILKYVNNHLKITVKIHHRTSWKLQHELISNVAEYILLGYNDCPILSE